MSSWIYIVYIAPYGIAVALARYAASLWAKRLVMITSAIMVGGLAIVFIFTAGCRSSDFVYHSCPMLSDANAKHLSALTVFLMFGYFVVSPFAVLAAMLLEAATRWRR